MPGRIVLIALASCLGGSTRAFLPLFPYSRFESIRFLVNWICDVYYTVTVAAGPGRSNPLLAGKKSSVKKLTLDLNSLRVETFEPSPTQRPEAGTVHAHAIINPHSQPCWPPSGGEVTMVDSCLGTCALSCAGTCGGSCYGTCEYSCYGTCDYSCRGTCGQTTCYGEDCGGWTDPQHC